MKPLKVMILIAFVSIAAYSMVSGVSREATEANSAENTLGKRASQIDSIEQENAIVYNNSVIG